MVLDLSENKLDGDIPPEIGFLKDLELLDLRYNLFTGAVPEEVCDILIPQENLQVDSKVHCDEDCCVKYGPKPEEETLTERDFEELDLFFDGVGGEMTFDFVAKDYVGGGLEGIITFEDEFTSVNETHVRAQKCVTVDDALSSVFINFDLEDVTWKELCNGRGEFDEGEVCDVKVESATLTLEEDPVFCACDCEDDVQPPGRRLAKRRKGTADIKRAGK